MKKRFCCIFLCVFFLCTASFLPITAANSADIPDSVSVFSSIDAKSAILMEASTGKVLFEKNAHAKKLTASICKVVTALAAFENLKLDNKNNYNVDKIVENLKDKNYNFKDIFNYLEDVSVSKYPQINDIKNKMKYYGATAALMSGSGSSVFGIFTDKNAAQTAFESFEKNTVFLAKFC